MEWRTAHPSKTARWCKNEDKVLAYKRDNLIFIYNLHPTESFTNYRILIHREGEFKVILDSDLSQFGDHSGIDTSAIHSAEMSFDENALHLYLSSHSALIIRKK